MDQVVGCQLNHLLNVTVSILLWRRFAIVGGKKSETSEKIVKMICA